MTTVMTVFTIAVHGGKGAGSNPTCSCATRQKKQKADDGPKVHGAIGIKLTLSLRSSGYSEDAVALSEREK